MNIHWAYSYFLYIGLPALFAIAYYRWIFYKKPIYRYSSLHPLKKFAFNSKRYEQYIWLLRVLSLCALCLALARPQIPDERSKVPVKGIDIMLVIDVSGSMECFDDLQDRRTRIEVARSEALKFVDRRENDAIGLVIFGNTAVSRCPLTLDKHILKGILKDTTIGIIDYNGTVLSKSILTAANRLKNSTAKSKIMIVLTDGEPTQGDSDPNLSIELAKKLGIKIYTIGIGSTQGGFVYHPFAGLIRAHSRLNIPLLESFARHTGGQFFYAQNPKDMEAIYNTIDKLEKVEYEKPIFARYFDLFVFLLWGAFIVLILEILLTSFIWINL